MIATDPIPTRLVEVIVPGESSTLIRWAGEKLWVRAPAAKTGPHLLRSVAVLWLPSVDGPVDLSYFWVRVSLHPL